MNDTETPALDGPRALALLREVVAERPDYVYEPPGSARRCVHVYAGRPSCIAGHVLIRAGFSPHDLAIVDDRGDGAQSLPDHLGRSRVSDNAAKILRVAQSRQDAGDPWSAALRSAEAKARLLGVSA
jgi:hypothetical protein